MLSSRANRALTSVCTLLAIAAFYLIPSWLWARVVSTALSGVAIACLTVEIRRDRERGPYTDERTSLGPRE